MSGSMPPCTVTLDDTFGFPVGGRFRHFAPVWHGVIADPFCDSCVSQGIVPDLLRPPPTRRLVYRPPPERHVLPMRDKISELLTAQIIRPADDPDGLDFSRQLLPGVQPWVPSYPVNEYHHGYFLVDKPPADDGTAKFRDILNAKDYNLFVVEETFKMEGIRTLKSLCRPGDFYIGLDISSAYPHAALHADYWKQFRFWALHPDTGEPTLFEYTSLPFGLRSAPRLFSRLSRAVARFLRRNGVRCIFYLDDWLILGSSAEECARHAAFAAFLLQSLGFIIHPEKSSDPDRPGFLAAPRQHGGVFLGLELNLRAEFMLLRLPAKKRKGCRRAVKWLLSLCFSPDCLSPRSLAGSIGKLGAGRDAVTGCMSHLRTLQRALKLALRTMGWDDSRLQLSSLPMLSGLISDLQWWETTLASPTAGQIKMMHYDHCIDTDAGPWAWGGFLGSESVGGFWTTQEQEWSQNRKEFCGIERTLKSFEPRLLRRADASGLLLPLHPATTTTLPLAVPLTTVLVQTDNATCVSYINREGGKVPVLSDLACSLLLWAADRSIFLRAVHLPGLLNTRADRRSRVSLNSWTYACLSHSLLPDILRKLDIPSFTCDLFADRLNKLAPRFFSLERDPDSSGRNALQQPWAAEIRPVAFPPLKLLPLVLDKIRAERCSVWLVAPDWQSASWYPTLRSLLVAPPLFLPPQVGTFRNPLGKPLPAPRWRMAVWTLCGNASSQMASARAPLALW